MSESEREREREKEVERKRERERERDSLTAVFRICCPANHRSISSRAENVLVLNSITNKMQNISINIL